MEIAGRTAIELLRLKHRAELLATANPNNPDVFHGFERETLKTLGGFVCQGLGWHITHNTDLPETLPSDRFVYFGNHPTLTAIWSWGAFLQEHFGTNIVAVGKKSVIENPLSRWFLGDLMRTAGKAIFIDRNNREEALSAIRSDAASLLTAGTGAVIFPDEHRPYPWRIRRQQEQWNLKRPDLEVSNWMTATCFPKSGGLWNFAEVIAGLDHVRFLDCTVVEPPSVFTFGAKLHFDVQEVSRGELLGVPESEEHLRGKLVELWQRKNEMIRERRSL
ncbi:1-acyl-sn-glycerol-3-phosphate acyltransferase [Candidatus Peregrinibacteria bacterium]|nr:1-acyl-sn-glycerol-3-phosphate acyltransferase [Candidatus Peregrinibacteria bacterium]